MQRQKTEAKASESDGRRGGASAKRQKRRQKTLSTAWEGLAVGGEGRGGNGGRRRRPGDVMVVLAGDDGHSEGRTQ